MKQTSAFKVAAAALLALIVLAGVILGGWQAGWWFTQQNVNRRAHVYRSSFEAQQTLRDEITKKIANYQEVHILSPGSAWEHGILNIICADADKVTTDPLPLDQQQFVQDNCQYGVAR